MFFSIAKIFEITSVLLAVNVSGEVTKLTVDTFDAFIESNPLTLVKFYAPWCGHCKALAPHYEEASDKLTNVKLVEVDVTEEEALGTRFEITGYPSLKFFRNGTPEEYQGGRTADTIVQWIEMATSEAVTKIESMEKVQEEFPDSNAVVAYCKAGSEEEASFTKLAEANRMVAKFFTVESSEHNMILMYRGSDKSTFPVEGTDAESQINFIKTEKLPFFGPISGENFSDYMETGLDFVWFAGVEADMTANKEALERFGKSVRGAANVVWMDTAVFEKQAEGMLGITEFPALVRTVDGPGRYIYSGDYNVDAMKTWMDDIKSGKVQLTLKSEEIPEKNDEPVKVVVGKQFDEIMAKDKDVLLEIYAPWCGHCKKLSPIYDDAAEKIAKLAPDVVLAKIDGTANEIPTEGYEFQGFPTLYWKKAGAEPVLYSGGRELDDIMKFLGEQGTKPFEWTPEVKETEEDKDEL